MKHHRTVVPKAWTVARVALAASMVLAGLGLPAAYAAPPPAGEAADSGGQAAGRPAPVLVISSYETSKERVLVGSRFTLTLDIRNETARRADNVVVSLAGASAATPTEGSSAGGGLAVLGTGNAKFVGDIRGERSASVSFDVVSGPAAPPGAVTVPVNIGFEYDGVRQELAYTIGLVLERDAGLTVSTASIPKTADVGETFDASFEVANSGAFALSGMSLSVEASGADVADSSMFVGAFESAGAETIDVTITPQKAGPIEVVLKAKYRDDFGHEKLFRQAYTVEVAGEPKGSVQQTAGHPKEAVDREGNWFVRFFRSLFGLGA